MRLSEIRSDYRSGTSTGSKGEGPRAPAEAAAGPANKSRTKRYARKGKRGKRRKESTLEGHKNGLDVDHKEKIIVFGSKRIPIKNWLRRTAIIFSILPTMIRL